MSHVLWRRVQKYFEASSVGWKIIVWCLIKIFCVYDYKQWFNVISLFFHVESNKKWRYLSSWLNPCILYFIIKVNLLNNSLKLNNLMTVYFTGFPAPCYCKTCFCILQQEELRPVTEILFLLGQHCWLSSTGPTLFHSCSWYSQSDTGQVTTEQPRFRKVTIGKVLQTTNTVSSRNSLVNSVDSEPVEESCCSWHWIVNHSRMVIQYDDDERPAKGEIYLYISLHIFWNIFTISLKIFQKYFTNFFTNIFVNIFLKWCCFIVEDWILRTDYGLDGDSLSYEDRLERREEEELRRAKERQLMDEGRCVME